MTDGHPVLRYTLMRLAIFVGPFLVLLAVGVDVFWSLLVAAFVSGTASLFLLSRQRDAVSASLATRTERARQRMAERTAAEDAWDDAQRAQTAGSDGLAEGEPEREK